MTNFFNSNNSGIIGTIVFHAVLLLILFTFGFSTPLPLPEEEGLTINYGTDLDGSGLVEPQNNNQEQIQPENIASSSEEDVVTQNVEETPVVKNNNKPNKTNTQVQNNEQKTEEQVQKVNVNALYPGNNSSGEGETHGNGNQGREDGSPNSPNHSGEGIGNGKGISFNLAGRSSQSLPKPEYKYQEEGKVVVEVKVDKSGRVISAVAGVKGSTTLNENLLDAARKAALGAKFDAKANAPEVQKGTITYIFLLQ